MNNNLTSIERATVAVPPSSSSFQIHDDASVTESPAPQGGGIDSASVQTVIKATALPDVLFVDLKTESNKLYAGYLNEAIMLSLAGLAGITGLLLCVLRSPGRVLRMIRVARARPVTERHCGRYTGFAWMNMPVVIGREQAQVQHVDVDLFCRKDFPR